MLRSCPKEKWYRHLSKQTRVKKMFRSCPNPQHLAEPTLENWPSNSPSRKIQNSLRRFPFFFNFQNTKRFGCEEGFPHFPQTIISFLWTWSLLWVQLVKGSRGQFTNQRSEIHQFLSPSLFPLGQYIMLEYFILDVHYRKWETLPST